MKLSKNRLRAAMAIVAVLTVLGLWIWHASPKGPEQIITTPDGAKYRFMGVTYSKENVPPSVLAKLLQQLPNSWANSIRQRIGDRDSQYNIGQKWDRPQLFFWFQRLTTNFSSPGLVTRQQRAFLPSAVLADDSGAQAGVQAYPTLRDDVVWSYVSFPLVPKRTKTIDLSSS